MNADPAEQPPMPLIDTDVVLPPVAADIDIVARRGTALAALGVVSHLLDMDVQVPHLVILADDENPDVRLNARRALRAIEQIGRPNSPVMAAIGEVCIYDYVEGVVEYGASELKYLELMERHGLRPPEVTGLYSLRKMIADEADGSISGFPTIIRALRSIGMSPQEAGLDPEEALAALYEAGFFVDHMGNVLFDRPIFWPFPHNTNLGRHVDTPKTADGLRAREWVLEHFQDLTPEETED